MDSTTLAKSEVRAGQTVMRTYAAKNPTGVRASGNSLTVDLPATADNVEPLRRRSSAAVVVEPVAQGSSHGVALAASPTEFTRAPRAAWELDERVLVEEVVNGRETGIAVLLTELVVGARTER